MTDTHQKQLGSIPDQLRGAPGPGHLGWKRGTDRLHSCRL